MVGFQGQFKKIKSNLTTKLAKSLHDSYSQAYPYPHISLDDFISADDIKTCAKEIKAFQNWGIDHTEYSRQFQQNKLFFPWGDITEADIKDILSSECPVAWSYLEYFNSPEFLLILENLTGIKGLIADYSFGGGGLHRILSGGKLAVHSDFNIHPYKPMYRRINLLVYLNDEWDDSWGGSLQLWESDMSRIVKEFQPKGGKSIIFNTTDDALHGHPHPLNSPEGIDRLSFALYYFTEDRPEHEKSEHKAAQWYKIDNSY